MKRFVALLMIIAALLTACADARLGKNAAGAVNEDDSKVIENPQDVTAKTLKALCVDGGDGLSTGISLHEYPAWSLENLAYRYDQSAPKTAEIDLLDMHFAGSYVTSGVLINASTYSTSLSHKYECVSEDGAAVEFWLDSKTGKLTQFGRIKTLSADGSVDEEKCRAAAEKIASEILGDKQNEYVVETRSDGTYYYSYCAYRMIDGCKSADRIIISVDREEKPAALIMSSLGSFDGISSLPFGKEAAETVIAEKIASVSPEIYGYKSYEIKDATPVVLEDGSVGCVYSVDVKTEYDEYDEEAGETYSVTGDGVIDMLVAVCTDTLKDADAVSEPGSVCCSEPVFEDGSLSYDHSEEVFDDTDIPLYLNGYGEFCAWVNGTLDREDIWGGSLYDGWDMLEDIRREGGVVFPVLNDGSFELTTLMVFSGWSCFGTAFRGDIYPGGTVKSMITVDVSYMEPSDRKDDPLEYFEENGCFTHENADENFTAAQKDGLVYIFRDGGAQTKNGARKAACRFILDGKWLIVVTQYYAGYDEPFDHTLLDKIDFVTVEYTPE